MNIHIFMDMFFVNDNIFLHTKSENINYRSAQSLNSRKSTEIANFLDLVERKYANRGVKIEK